MQKPVLLTLLELNQYKKSKKIVSNNNFSK